MDGILVIDKPPGPTSHDVVAAARRALGARRVGHTGTLDPLASGVLPLAIGRATRLAQFLTHTVKAYTATIRLGYATTTYDRTGAALDAGEWRTSPVVESRGPRRMADEVTDAEIDEALRAFEGRIAQSPPAFSAKKVGGRRAYELARQERAPHIEAVEVVLLGQRRVARCGDLVIVDVTCSPGFYVRSLAHDLGVWLGCGAHVAELRRTRSGSFRLDHAVPFGAWDAAPGKLVALESLLPWMPSATLSPDGLARVRHGQPARSEDLAGGVCLPPAKERSSQLEDAVVLESDGDVPVRLFSDQGTLVGLAKRRPGSGLLHPFLNLV